VLAKQLGELLGDKSGLTLVVGLGNWHMTPDALGPKVVDRVLVTRHIKEYAASYFDRRMGVVAAISPGVLGITGIETAELIRGAVDRMQPARVICIDSLASRRSQRITTSFQLSDAGIHLVAGASGTVDAVYNGYLAGNLEFSVY
jgi:spore protease